MLRSADRLRSIKTFKQLVRYLEDELDWPLEEYGFEELTYEYKPSEVGLKDDDSTQVQIFQLRPIPGMPWGIFFVEFHKKRMPVVVLRRILSHLVLKKRASANKAKAAAWNLDDLLFISAFGEQIADQREISFAHFHQEKGDLPTLRVLGWDGADTILKLEDVDASLHERLRWPNNPADVDAWRKQWSRAFRHRIGHVIRTADVLAEVLASLARGIRDAARTLMNHESERGQLRKLHKAFQTALIHDLTEESFADTYAQTITYGLLTAAISRTDMSEGRHDTALIAENVADMVPITNPFLREMLETFIQAGGRRGGIDFDELGIQDVVELLRGDETDLPAILRDFGNKTRGEDPVIHFYEHFLNAYNKQLKIQRGVFYTPQPVVSYIVRSVDELLQTEFGLEDGLASTITWGAMAKRNPDIKIPEGVEPDSPFVIVLDPATGTATFLVEVIDVIYHTVTNKWKKAGMSSEQQRTAWNDYVPQHLLPRLYGYELMMAPYAIAHMKIGLKLAETGYRFGTEERVRIYLTNALEPWVKQLSLVGFDALAHEAAAVNEIKRHKRFTIVIGNPPYANYGQLNKIPFILGLLDDYKRGLDEKKLNLDDDFIKFIRFSQHLLDMTDTGVFGMITNNSFVDGITHRQMRQSLLSSFIRLYVLNLHGSSKKKEKAPDGSQDENVFDIQQGVSTIVGVLSPLNVERKVFVGDLWGRRVAKYAALQESNVLTKKWTALTPAAPYFFFTEKNFDDGAEYNDYIDMKSIFMVSGNGVKTERDGVSIHFTRLEIETSVHDFQSLNEATLRRKYEIGDDSRDWTVKKAKADVLEHKGRPLYRQLLYRPFDIRHTWYSGQTRGFIGTPAFPTMRHMRDGNIAMVTTRQTAEKFDLLCTDKLVGHKSVAGYDINTAFPLYIFEDALNFNLGERDAGALHGVQKRPNFSGQLLKSLASILGLQQKGEHHLPAGLIPEDIFHYAYAVFHSPGYRGRYAQFLKIDFPRLPLTQNLELFRKLVHLGGELVALHLLESPKLDKPITEFIGGRNPEVKKMSWSKNIVWVDKAQTTGFKGVREDVWNFHIGGYQVCEKWLKDRKGRKLLKADIYHYQKIVVALNETIRLMKEIDEVIEQYGGWPIK